MIPNSQLLNLWYLALGEPVGLSLTCPSPNHAKTVLYSARSKARDPLLTQLSIRTSPTSPHTEIWIVRDFIPEPHRGGAHNIRPGGPADAS